MGTLTPRRRRTRLAGSTLVEAIVASVIFMCVFAISLETVSRLTVRDDDSAVLVEADRRVRECLSRYGDGAHENGRYTARYDWGTVTALLTPYGAYAGLQELRITAQIESISKQLEIRHIIEVVGDE